MDYLCYKYVNQKYFAGGEPPEGAVASIESDGMFEGVYFRQQLAKGWDDLTSDEAHLWEGKYIMGYINEEVAAYNILSKLERVVI